MSYDFTKFIEESKDSATELSTSFMETILFLSHIIFQNGSKHATFLVNFDHSNRWYGRNFFARLSIN